MKLARKIAEQSPDPKKKVGIIAVNEFGHILATGYNHTRGLTPPEFLGDRATERRPFIIHAEIQMLCNLDYCSKIEYCCTTLFPCEHCMIALAARRVPKIIYDEIYVKDHAALEVAAFYGIECYKWMPST